MLDAARLVAGLAQDHLLLSGIEEDCRLIGADDPGFRILLRDCLGLGECQARDQRKPSLMLAALLFDHGRDALKGAVDARQELAPVDGSRR
jgi:hypothetical protein